MTKIKKKVLISKDNLKSAAISNDGMNTPVLDKKSVHKLSVSEAALFKQAENPLGDPNKI